MFFIGDITYPHIDQNGISGKLTKNELTSPNNNFFGNGRTKLVYDSFWPQGPPELRKNVWDGFPNLPGLPGPICDFSRFFRGFRAGPPILENPCSWTSESEKIVRKLIFSKCFEILKKYDTWAPFWYIHIDRTPNIRGAWVFWKLIGHFSILIGL